MCTPFLLVQLNPPFQNTEMHLPSLNTVKAIAWHKEKKSKFFEVRPSCLLSQLPDFQLCISIRVYFCMGQTHGINRDNLGVHLKISIIMQWARSYSKWLKTESLDYKREGKLDFHLGLRQTPWGYYMVPCEKQQNFQTACAAVKPSCNNVVPAAS